MKTLCLLLVLATSSAYAQKVRENVKMKTQSQDSRVKYIPEKFESSDMKIKSFQSKTSSSRSKKKN